MSHNPVLNSYLIELNPIDKKQSTFKHFCKAKFFKSEENPSDREIFKSLFENFLKELAGDKLINDKKAKKVLGVQQSEGINNTIIFHTDDKVIEGIIDGGKYGILRQVADIENNKEREPLGSKKAILDKYYFYLYTPLNSCRGIFMIQSYTEETIQQPFKDFLKNFFSCEDHFYNLNFDNYVPDRVIKEFVAQSQITMFKYKTIIGVGTLLRKQIDSSIEGFEVVIEIKPISGEKKIAPKEKNIKGIANLLGKKKFEKILLNDMPNPKIFIKNYENRNAHFDISEQIENIKPTIYLVNEGVQVDEDSGLPNFSQMKTVCDKLLKEITVEIAKKMEIDEF